MAIAAFAPRSLFFARGHAGVFVSDVIPRGAAPATPFDHFSRL
jgi:hypothetical protein